MVATRVLLTTLLLPAGLSMAWTPRLAAQDVAGTLTGQIVGPDSLPVAGARIAVDGPSATSRWTLTADSMGAFRLAALPVGAYRMRVDASGYRSVVVTDAVVRLGRTTALGRIVLAVEPVGLDPILVRADPSLVDPASTDLGFDLNPVMFEKLPTGRDYKSIIAILPQANESFLGDPVNIAGATGLENAYHVEGINVTDIYRGRTGTDLPYNFVKAIEVKQGGYQAEYGGALGGIVNVVTHSGGAAFEWRATGYASGSALAARSAPIPDVLASESFTDFDVGLSASGPLRGESLTFFAAYNPSFAGEDVRLGELGIERSSVTKHMFAGKLDWKPTSRSGVTLTVFGDPTSERRVSPAPGITLANPDPVLSSNREGGTNVALRWTARPGDRWLLEASAGRHARNEDAEGATELGRSEPSFIDRTRLPAITLSGGNGTNQRIASARTSVRFDASRLAGRHTLKAGVEYQVNRLDVRNDENPGQIAQLGPSLFRSSIFIQDFTVRNRVVSLYLQDGWDVGDRLRLNGGLRWDGQYLFDQNGDLAQSIADQLQPRVGFNFRPDAAGRSRIFGHAGRFYQQLALLWSTIGLAGFDQRQVFSSVDPRTDPGRADSTLVLSDPATIRGGTDGLRGEHHDELVLGYERQVGARTLIGLRGVHRELRESITAAYTPDRRFVGGNPGRGDLSHLPASKRRYQAIELSVRHEGPRLSALASYVLSRSRGNYPGLFVADAGGLRGGSLGPNNNQLTYFPAQSVNAEGPLPNDRPHVFKLAAAWTVTSALQAGTFFSIQSGTPLSRLGRVTAGFNAPLFLTPRGSEGRTPSITDLSLRITLRLPRLGGLLRLDMLHIGNPQQTVNIDQRQFNGARGSPWNPYETLVANQTGERPGYGAPIGFQPPFQVRIGFEAGR